MDLFTHALVGAAGAAALAPRQSVRIAACTGATAGLLPDTDVLIESAADPLLNLELHRHFTHSLAITPIGALLAALLVWLVMRRRVAFAQLYAYALVGYLLSPLLDACTSYGTHLFWPFAERPVAWGIIAIIDPVFTAAVAIPLAIGLMRSRTQYAYIALGLAGIVLLAGLVQRERAFQVASALATHRAHDPTRILVKPTLANMVLWRSLYISEDRIYVDAIRVGLPGNTRVYAGQNAPRFDPRRDLDLPSDALLRKDVARFVTFTDGLPVRHPTRPEMIGDARYAMLPTSIEPLWGIVIDTANPESRAHFETNRKLTAHVRQRFIDMLLGRD